MQLHVHQGYGSSWMLILIHVVGRTY